MAKDELDRKLLTLLQSDARASTADLARQLGVARTTIVARLARLEHDRVIVGYTVRLGADDHAVTFQPGQSGDDGGARDAQLAGQVGAAGAGIGLQQRQQLAVKFVFGHDGVAK